MSERDEKRGGFGLCHRAGGDALYVLGLGPAVWISRLYPATDSVFIVIYYPIEGMHRHLGSFGELLVGTWYCGDDFSHRRQVRSGLGDRKALPPR